RATAIDCSGERIRPPEITMRLRRYELLFRTQAPIHAGETEHVERVRPAPQALLPEDARCHCHHRIASGPRRLTQEPLVQKQRRFSASRWPTWRIAPRA